MLVRKKLEVEYADLFDRFNLGTTVWSQLLGGVLTGKYNNEIPDNTRLANDDPDM
jgi:aryl-alcohol dehydrogenase-like predicted oxidoreductase